MNSPLWICEECGGPAVWTFIEGEVYYHCEEQCDGFCQLELFDEERVCSPLRSDAGVDTVVSPSQGPQAVVADDGLPF